MSVLVRNRAAALRRVALQAATMRSRKTSLFHVERVDAPYGLGPGRPGDFLRWMRLTKPFVPKNSSLAFER